MDRIFLLLCAVAIFSLLVYYTLAYDGERGFAMMFLASMLMSVMIFTDEYFEEYE